MGLIDSQLETIKDTTVGKELKTAIVEALDILDEHLPHKYIEEVDH